MQPAWPTLLVLLLTVPAAHGALEPLRAVDGRLVGSETGGEMPLCGTNYLAPFGIPYANLLSLGIDPTLVIRTDLRQIALLGLRCVRVLVSDAEIMAANGSLVENQHLELLDYLIATAAEEGLYTILTPIGYSPGIDPVRVDGVEVSLRSRFGAAANLVRQPEARAAAGRYLAALASRTNRFTGRTYAAEPAIAVWDLLGQPVLDSTVSDAELTAALDGWVEVLRTAGVAAPIVYWTGHGTAPRVEAVLASRCDGISISAYPGGVGAGFDDHTDRLTDYATDFGLARPALRKVLRVCVEFDSADALAGHMLPAIAASLRAGGAAVACQFQYDTGAGAWRNNEWPSHWLNLAPMPGRAVALAAAAAAFEWVPPGMSPPRYPLDYHGGPLRLEPDPDTARWMDARRLIYNNSLGEQPPTAEAIDELIGVGSSRLVEYDGLGAVLLKRLEPGVWRLILMPEPHWVGNPFDPARWRGPAGLAAIAGLSVEPRVLRVRLPDLDPDFRLWWLRSSPRGAEPVAFQQAEERALLVRPGVALLVNGRERPAPRADIDGDLPLIPPLPEGPILDAALPPVAEANRALRLTAQAAGDPDLEVSLRLLTPAGEKLIAAKRPDLVRRATRDVPTRAAVAAGFEVEVPMADVAAGEIRVQWIATDGFGETCFPADGPAAVAVGSRLPYPLVEFGRRRDPVQSAGLANNALLVRTTGGAEPGRVGRHIEVERFGADGRWWLRAAVPPNGGDLSRYDAVRLRARGAPEPTRLRLYVVEADGATWAVTADLPAEYADIQIPLRRFGYAGGGRQRAAVDPSAVREARVECGAALHVRVADARRSIDLDDLAWVSLPQPAR